MIPARMSRPVRVLFICAALLAAVVLVSACGTQKISVSKSDPVYAGAVLFAARCAGCHTLAYAGTHGSASNPRSAEYTNGPNFNIRCERPITRVLHAIENGGFSGAIMPQNVVVGQDAIHVAEFVSKYAGRSAPRVPGQTPCDQIPIGSILAPGATTSPTATTATTPAAQQTPSGKSKTVPTGKGGKAKSNTTGGTKTKTTTHP